MFTGIITDIGEVAKISTLKEGKEFTIKTNYNTEDIDIGASIACDGACHTVTQKGSGWYKIFSSAETLSKTALNSWQEGSKINLERSLKVGDELGGHIVSGHVDGIANIDKIENIVESFKMAITAPDSLKYFIAKKGSIAISGISLTVNNINNNQFDVNIIPHTWTNTNLNELKEGDKVNIEIDTIARYTARLLEKN